MKNKIFNNKLLIGLMFLVFGSCTSMDEYYKEFIPLADKIYPGKVDSVEVYPGYNRLVINSLLSYDPEVVKLRIYWQNRKDSITIDIISSDIGNRKEVLLSQMEEGPYSFELVTYDAMDNNSVISEGFGRSFGDKYISTLNNRIIKESGVNSEDIPYVKWMQISSETLIGAKVFYQDQQGEIRVILSPVEDELTLLPNYVFGDTVRYCAMYMPDVTAIDTFYSEEKWIVLQDN